MPKTDRANYRFVAKGSYTAADGSQMPPNITLEPQGKGLPVLQGGLIQLNLRAGLDDAKTEELADLLNKYVDQVSYTK
jgi:hypothetical protein